MVLHWQESNVSERFSHLSLHHRESFLVFARSCSHTEWPWTWKLVEQTSTIMFWTPCPTSLLDCNKWALVSFRLVSVTSTVIQVWGLVGRKCIYIGFRRTFSFSEGRIQFEDKNKHEKLHMNSFWWPTKTQGTKINSRTSTKMTAGDESCAVVTWLGGGSGDGRGAASCSGGGAANHALTFLDRSHSTAQSI